jgi:hypothetical protein
MITENWLIRMVVRLCWWTYLYLYLYLYWIYEQPNNDLQHID